MDSSSYYLWGPLNVSVKPQELELEGASSQSEVCDVGGRVAHWSEKLLCIFQALLPTASAPTEELVSFAKSTSSSVESESIYFARNVSDKDTQKDQAQSNFILYLI